MKICFTGDVIMLESPPECYWASNSLIERMIECDIVAGNLEMVLSGKMAPASQYCGGQWLSAEPDMIEEIKRYGFNYFNTANNHTMDYGIEGVKLTNDLLDRKSIFHTGSGESLRQSAKPVFMETNGIKTGFISMTASCNDAAMAGDSINGVPSRGGVNMLRHDETLYVTYDQLSTIDDIAEKTAVNARFLKAVKMGTHSMPEGIHRLGRLCFKEEITTRKETSCNKKDLTRMIAQIENAKNSGAHLVFVSIHSHDIKGKTDDTPDDYTIQFAHKCIDAGANAVIGTGTHQLKGIEIYRKCPIFYSLGDFCFKCEKMPYAPMEYYERYDVKPDIDPDMFFEIRTKKHTTGLEYDPINYKSVVPFLEYDSMGVLTNMFLLPIELGFSLDKRQKGYPSIANSLMGTEIANRLSELSEEYGIQLSYDKKERIIRVDTND